MPINDVAMQDRMLDAMLNVVASWDVALFAGDPSSEDDPGVELSATTDLDDGAGGIDTVSNGYARATGVTWPLGNADGGASTATGIFPDSLAEWDTATHWAAVDPVTGQWGPSAALLEPLTVTGPGTLNPVLLTVFFDNPVEEI